MALTKETVVDKIEVMEMGEVQVRTATRVIEDGVELSSSFHRHVLDPSTKASGSWADTDISGEDARVQAIATATWTSSVKTAYQEMIDAQSI
jgi:K+-transporting ATPase c subunit